MSYGRKLCLTLVFTTIGTLFQAALVRIAMPQATPAKWKPVEEALGKSGTMQPDDVFRVSLPRNDLKVTARGVPLKPAFALGSWLAFKQAGSEAMVMGDLVLTEPEVNPVMLKLQEGGIEQTALHNHIFEESPRILYMHISGHGNAVKMAQAIRAALALSKTPFSATPSGDPESLDLDVKQIDQVIGHSGRINAGVLQFSVPRQEPITEAGMNVPPAMGLGTVMNFQPTGAGKAAITGDFVLLAPEVNKVIRALRQGGVEVTALHSHMLNEQPRLFFMHFWANDDAVKLARVLRAALDQTNSAKGSAR